MNTINFFGAHRRSVPRSVPAQCKIAQPRRFSLRAAAVALALSVMTSWTTLIAVGVLTPASARADMGTSPMAVTQTMVNRALQIMADKSTPVAQRRRELREAIENEFDFSEMSRSALGYHWRNLGPDDRSQFTQLFTAFIEDAYLSKIQDYSGQQVRFDGQTSLGQGYTQINSDIVEPGKSPIAVNYLLLQKGDTWKIYDVTVDAISIIANYRNQFNRVINEKGFPQLMADLRAKQQELSSMLNS
jgi:phospholipid transport system substrate-binding protein